MNSILNSTFSKNRAVAVLCSLLMILLFSTNTISAQTISGKIYLDKGIPSIHTKIAIDSTQRFTDRLGRFKIPAHSHQTNIINIDKQGYQTVMFPIVYDTLDIDLGTIYLQRKPIQIVSKPNKKLYNRGKPLLQQINDLPNPAKDLFFRRSVFDFGQVFYKRRGLQNEDELLINGVSVNTLDQNKPQWAILSGLSDVIRSQELTFHTAYIPYHFGGMNSTNQIIINPSKQRKGLKLTPSYTNRQYNARFMATYHSGVIYNKFAYSLSVSKRMDINNYTQGNRNRLDGLFGSLMYLPSQRLSFTLAQLYASSIRSSKPALTKEVFDLTSNRYNPYWGYQNGKIRNSRVKTTKLPTSLLTIDYHTDKLKLTTTFLSTYGKISASRLDYISAPNPNPIYYRKLPSYYLNDSSNSTEVTAVKNRFLKNQQIDWQHLYDVNTRNIAKGVSYMLYADAQRIQDHNIIINSEYRLSPSHWLSAGAGYKNHQSEYFGEILDLLGGKFYNNIDNFSDKRYDLNSSITKNKVGDIVRYHYRIDVNRANGYLQYRFRTQHTDNFIAAGIENIQYARYGFAKHENHPDAVGESPTSSYNNYKIKLGHQYRIHHRHQVLGSVVFKRQYPNYRQLYYNARENADVIPEVLPEDKLMFDMSYLYRISKWNGKLTGYYYTSKNATQIRYYYSSSGLGSDFFREVSTGIDTQHLGVEYSSEIVITPRLKANVVAAVGQYIYTNDPMVRVNFDVGSSNERLINPNGFADLGAATMKNYFLPSPQQAFSVGFDYSSPRYWRANVSFNLLRENYISVSKIARTESFYNNENDVDGFPFAESNRETARALLKQELLPEIFFIDCSFFKSWYIKQTYLMVVIGINNLLDTIFATGGYEQVRAANYRTLYADVQKGTRTFGPKYWTNQGRTFFITLSWTI